MRPAWVFEGVVFLQQLCLEREVRWPLQKHSKHLVPRDHELSAGVVLLACFLRWSPRCLVPCGDDGKQQSLMTRPYMLSSTAKQCLQQLRWQHPQDVNRNRIPRAQNAQNSLPEPTDAQEMSSECQYRFTKSITRWSVASLLILRSAHK